MVGVIDSGSGGANVIIECMKYYNEDFIYLVDNQNSPYGNRPAYKVLEITKSNIENLLKEYKLDLIIIACNTASSIIDITKMGYNVPIITTSPNLLGVEGNGCDTLLFATKNTIKHNKKVQYYLSNYSNFKTANIKNFAKNIDFFIKNGDIYAIFSLLSKKFTLHGVLKKQYKNVKNIALGCTHFKHIKGQLKKIFTEASFLECEYGVAINSKYLIRRNRHRSSIKVILTKDEPEFERAIKNLFNKNLLVN